MGPSRPSRVLQPGRTTRAARDINKSARGPALRRARMNFGFLEWTGVFWFEIVAGRVKYSGPRSTRTTRLPPKFQTHRVDFPPEFAGRRLDVALAALLPQYSRTRIQRWIGEGGVLINGMAVKPRDLVTGGE